MKSAQSFACPACTNEQFILFAQVQLHSTASWKEARAALPNSSCFASAAEPQRVLDLHNQYRAKHQVGPLSWDNTLSSFAQNWANRCNFVHSSGSYGENIAWGHSSFAAAVTDWYSEVSSSSHVLSASACTSLIGCAWCASHFRCALDIHTEKKLVTSLLAKHPHVSALLMQSHWCL
jgi:hypothetical protein